MTARIGTVMDITGLHRVAIIAADYMRSRRIYAEVLALQAIAEVYRA